MGKPHIHEKIFRYLRQETGKVGRRKMKGRMRSVIAIAMTLVLIFGITFSYGDIDDMKDKLAEGEQQEKELASQINSLQDQVANLENRISSTEKKISKLSAQLEKEKAKLEEREEELGKRLRTMYKNGSVGFIDVLLSSENVSELLSNLQLIQYIYSNDEEAVAFLQDQYDSTKKKTEELKTLKADLDEEKGKLDHKESQLAAKKSKVSAANKALEKKIDEELAASESLIGYGGSGGGSYGGGQFAWPTPGYYNITSQFGYRIHPILGYKKFHAGIDIGAPSGVRVVAAASGTVVLASWYGGLGNCVMINHGGGLSTVYGHNSSLTVSVGQSVRKGQTIARVGSTGNSTGPHCHFEVHSGGALVNPLNYL